MSQLVSSGGGGAHALGRRGGHMRRSRNVQMGNRGNGGSTKVTCRGVCHWWCWCKVGLAGWCGLA